MNLFDLFENSISQDDLQVLAQGIKDRLGLASLELYMAPEGFTLTSLIAGREKSQQGSGKGTAAMETIVGYADQHGLKIFLTPAIPGDKLGTTSRARLIKFYKKFGFVENKGRNKDFITRDSMYRLPKKQIQEGSMISV